MLNFFKGKNNKIEILEKEKASLEKEIANHLAKIKELEKEKEKKEKILNQPSETIQGKEEKKAILENLKKEFENIIKEEKKLSDEIKKFEAASGKEKDIRRRAEIKWNILQIGERIKNLTAKKQNLEKEIELTESQTGVVEKKELEKQIEEISKVIFEEKRKLEEKTKKREEIERKIIEEKKKEEERKREEEKRIQEEQKKLQEELKKQAEEKKAKEEQIKREKEKRLVEEQKIEEEKHKKEEKEKMVIKKREEKPQRTLKEKWQEQLKKIKESEIWSDLTSVTHYQIVGIDISDYSVEVLSLDRKGKLLSYGRSVLEEGIIQDGVILNQKKLVDTLKETLKNAKPFSLNPEAKTELRAVISLPESKTYIQYFVFNDNTNLEQKIQEKIKETVPVPFKDLYYDFLKINNEKGEIRILLVAAKEEIIGSYIYLLRVTGLLPLVVDVESASIARALLPGLLPFEKERNKKINGEPTMILDIGARTTILSIHNRDGIMCLSVSMPYAGIYFTRKIAENFNLSFQAAEEKKINQGFKKDAEVSPILEKECQKIIDEAKLAKRFYETEFKEKITKIILAGGSALLPEIDFFFQRNFPDAKVEIGNPLLKIKAGKEFDQKRAVLYANVIGLALRGISPNPLGAGINLLSEKIKKREWKNFNARKNSILFAAFFFALSGLLLLGTAIFYRNQLSETPPMISLKPSAILEISELNKKERTVLQVKEEFATSGVPLFIEPQENAEKILSVTSADMLELIEERNGWLKIKVGEKEGWIKSDYVDIMIVNP